MCCTGPIRLNLSARLISHAIIFFSHNETASTGLSAAETISRTKLGKLFSWRTFMLALSMKITPSSGLHWLGGVWQSSKNSNFVKLVKITHHYHPLTELEKNYRWGEF